MRTGKPSKEKISLILGAVISSRGWAPCMAQSTHCPEPLLNTDCVPAGMTDISPEMANARVRAYVETRWPRGEKIDLKMQTGEGVSLEGMREKGIKVSWGLHLGTKIYNLPALGLAPPLPILAPFLFLAACSRHTHYLY